jgi:hypothetical protein
MIPKSGHRFSEEIMLQQKSMIPKKPAPDLIRGGHRFSEEIMLQHKEHDPEKACPGLDPMALT